MRDFVRDWSHAEYCLAPLENLAVLDEKRLTGSPPRGGLGYRIQELALISEFLIPYGGLHDIALAMGARVIAMGRNVKTLETLKSKVPCPERVETVPITGSVTDDTAALKAHGQIDAFFDIGPPEAYASTHIKSAILALRHGAKISLMGGYKEDVANPHVWIMHRNMRLYGKWMYERTDVADMIKMVETGALRLGQKGGLCLAGEYSLEEWKDAWDHAAEDKGFGRSGIVEPLNTVHHLPVMEGHSNDKKTARSYRNRH
nr:hypothetical protein CFP56_63531 [Quercus suber]